MWTYSPLQYRYLIDALRLPAQKLFLVPFWNLVKTGTYYFFKYQVRLTFYPSFRGHDKDCPKKELWTLTPQLKTPSTCILRPKRCVKSMVSPCPPSEVTFLAHSLENSLNRLVIFFRTCFISRYGSTDEFDSEEFCLELHQSLPGKVGCFSGGSWSGDYLISLLSSTSIAILLGFHHPLYETHHVDMLLYHGINVVSTHSKGFLLSIFNHSDLDLTLDREYRDVVYFVNSTNEIPALIDQLLGNKTNLTHQMLMGQRFVQEKVHYPT